MDYQILDVKFNYIICICLLAIVNTNKTPTTLRIGKSAYLLLVFIPQKFFVLCILAFAHY